MPQVVVVNLHLFQEHDLDLYSELYPDEAIGDFKLFEPFIMVIVSHWPFMDQFKDILKGLYLIKNVKSIKYPIQSFLCNLIFELSSFSD